MQNTKLIFGSEVPTSARTGVSLHCHTKYSKEFLDFVPYYAEKYPIVSSLFRMGCRRFERTHGKQPNFSLGRWEPPLDAQQLIGSESESLVSLGLRPIVSITDHDSIQAGLDLDEAGSTGHPISMEWTVPFGEAYFHVGVHNLPPKRAEEISRVLLDYTFSAGRANENTLREVLTLLHECPEILVVLNHPFWDIEMIGQERHDAALASFTKTFRHYLHAVEINGFRPWLENRLAMELAEEIDLPCVSGGDRHCLHHNSMINLTDADSFSAFVDEVRVEKRSQVMILPEYSKSLTFRQARSISQIMGSYPEFPESRRDWAQRVFFDWEDGSGLEALADRWGGRQRAHYRWAIGIFGLLGSNRLKRLWDLIDPAELPLFATEGETEKMRHSVVNESIEEMLGDPIPFFDPRIDSLRS